MSATLWDHVLAALFGLVLPGLGAWRHFRQQQNPSAADPAVMEESWDRSQKIATYWTNAAFLTLASGLVLWAWWGAGRALADLGFVSPKRAAEGVLLGLFLIALYAVDVRRQLVPFRLERTRQRWRSQTPFMPVAGKEQAHSLIMVLSAAICEEIIFRGFLIRYVQIYTGDSVAGTFLALLLPALVFAVVHFYQGLAAVVKIAVLAVMLGTIFSITESLWIPMAVHFVLDLCGILLSPLLLDSGQQGHPSPRLGSNTAAGS